VLLLKRKISSAHSLFSELYGLFISKLVSLLLPPSVMELLEGKEIAALWSMNHAYCNSEDPIMALGTLYKVKLKITKG